MVEMVTQILCSVWIVLIWRVAASELSPRCYDSATDNTFKNKLSQVLRNEEPVISNPSTRMCADWCNNSWMEPEVLDCGRGRVRFFIVPSPVMCNHTRYRIVLRVYNATRSQCVPGNLFREHTEIEIDVNRSSSSQSQKHMMVDVDYVFTGCYQLDINPKERENSRQPCYSAPFYVNTNYTLAFITKPTATHAHYSSGYEASFYWEPSSKPELELIDVNLYALGPLNQEKEIMNCSLDSSDYIYSPNPVTDNGCDCSWELIAGKYNMRCFFHDLNPGKYKVTVMAHDPRCNPDTIWTDLNPEILNANENPNGPHCYWSVINTYNGSKNTGSFPVSPDNHYWIVFTSLSLTCILLIAICLYCYCKIRPPQPANNGYNQIVKQPFQICLSKKTKLLLLYPRDCEPFMEAMECFRSILKCTGKFEVFDGMDPAQEENVALNSNTWGLNLISDPSTKVILVASWCSLRFYEALLDKDRLSYVDKKAFDSLFSLHLDQLFVQKQPYKKIYVVRLDCDNAENLCFEHIVQSRNFTLPQCIESLVNQLLELPPDQSVAFQDNNEKSVAKLRDSIEIYSQYVKENPNYLNKLITDNLMIDTQSLDYNVL